MEYNKQSNISSDPTMANSGHFRDYMFTPAVVILATDPKNYCRVKVAAPGVFNDNNTDPKLLPWCYPWIMCGNAAYSSMEKGSKVWLIKNKKRQDECWYVPMYELHNSAQEYVTQHNPNKKELLSYRNNGGSCDFIRYNNVASTEVESGNSNIHASKNGIDMTSGGGGIKINSDGHVSLGPTSSEANEPMALASTTSIKLKELAGALQNIAKELLKSVSDFNPGIASALIASLGEFIQNTDSIKSDTITLNENHVDKALEGQKSRTYLSS